MFQDHKFFLGTIEKLSPQAISFIIDYRNWPEFTFQFTGMSIGNEIPDQFQRPFIEAYFSSKRITNSLVMQRGLYIINELQQQDFIKCLEQNNSSYRVYLTDLGIELYEYLN